MEEGAGRRGEGWERGGERGGRGEGREGAHCTPVKPGAAQQLIHGDGVHEPEPPATTVPHQLLMSIVERLERKEEKKRRLT